MDEARLGRLQDGLEHYRRALPLLDALARGDPANASYQRALVSTYSHLGDVLGNPKWRSLGDAPGALQAYGQMLDVARRLHETDPANQQAASDYAIALTRVAAVTPDKESVQRLAMLRESLDVLLQIERVNPQNGMNRWDLAHGYWLLGDALLPSDRPGGIRAFEESVALAEGLIAAGVNSPAPDLVAVRLRLGVLAARAGKRDAALAHARRALEISDPAGELAKGRPVNVQRFLTPRGSAAMGLIYAALAGVKDGLPETTRSDREQARDWLQKSLAAWREIQSDPAFSPAHRQEMQQVESAAAGLGRLPSNP